MLNLGQRNDDSLARDFDWFGSSERLEISPASIWVPDEDETIRQRRVTVHQPPIVEENFDYYWSLHEISPQVSVNDDDLFAKPRSLPEINPQVSVRDEDSFAKPRPLPEIDPHVSVRDEDSFAKPSALPEILPQISILDELQASDSSPQFSSGVCGMDESQVQPGEPSFMTMDGQEEKTFVQEYMELGPSHASELESSSPTELELESSPATELEPSRPAQLESSRPAVSPRVRVLDESQILPGEASFATAIQSGEFAPRSHSPLEEFLAKTNLDLRTLMLTSLLIVSIIAISALVIMEATTGIFSSKFVASATSGVPSPNADSAAPQSQVLPTTKPIAPVAPVAMSKPSKQESQSMAPPREYPKFPGEVSKPMSREGSIPDLSRKAHSNDVRVEKPDRQSAGKSASRETSRREDNKHAAPTKNLRANLKESGARKKPVESGSRHSASSQRRTAVNKSNSKTTARKPASASAKNATITRPKAEVKVPSASNGAQRPRTVTPRKTS